MLLHACIYGKNNHKLNNRVLPLPNAGIPMLLQGCPGRPQGLQGFWSSCPINDNSGAAYLYTYRWDVRCSLQ
jgi:hypothetical protein